MVFDKFTEAFILPGCLGLIAWTDWKYRKIPNDILVFLLSVKSLRLFWKCLSGMETGRSLFLEGIGGFILGGGLLLICRLVSKRGVGAGDVKLFAVLGYWLGSRRIVFAACLTAMLAACCSMVLLIFRQIDLKQKLPLAPFVLAGTVGILYMEWILNQ